MQNEEPRMFPVRSSIINDILLTSLLIFKITKINVLAKSLILLDTFALRLV